VLQAMSQMLLVNLDDLQRRCSRNGTEYLVAER
jgi:hypothetical protein